LELVGEVSLFTLVRYRKADALFDQTGFKMIRLLAFEQHQQSNHPNMQQGVKDALVTH